MLWNGHVAFLKNAMNPLGQMASHKIMMGILGPIPKHKTIV
jgi:hypothetical protein